MNPTFTPQHTVALPSGPALDPLVQWLAEQQVATLRWPTGPAEALSEPAQQRVEDVIELMALGQVEAIAFDSARQPGHLHDVAARRSLCNAWHVALERTRVAALGLITGQRLQRRGLRVDVVLQGPWATRTTMLELVGRVQDDWPSVGLVA